MANKRMIYFSHGDNEEIAFTSRNDMNLAVWEGDQSVRLYSYRYEDTFKERVGRFMHYGLTQLWDTQVLMDLKVIVGGQVFRCHKIIMASISGFFKSELTSEQFRRGKAGKSGSGSGTGSGTVAIPDSATEVEDDDSCTIVLDESFVSPEMFELLLDMVYKGRNIVQDEHALDLIKAACYLRMKSLELHVLDILTKQVGERSCLKLWDWAERNNVPSLATKAKSVALKHFQVLRHTEDFLKMPVERLTMMLGHEMLIYRFEDDILETILDWVDYEQEDRRKHLKELMPYVCFPYLSTRYLNELRKHPLIGLRSEFSSFLDEALTFHLAALQKDGKRIQMEVLSRQAQSLKRLMPNMHRVSLLIGGAVVQDEPLTNVVACFRDSGRHRELYQYSVASLPVSIGLNFASTTWKNDVFVSGGSRAPDTLLMYKPNDNTWYNLKPMPRGLQDHAMVANDGRLYVLGGRATSKGRSEVVADISFYDIEADAWMPLGKLSVAVEAAAAVVLADKIYVFGGRTENGGVVKVVQVVELGTGESRLAGQLPEEVAGAQAIVLGQIVVLVTPQGNIYSVSSQTAQESTRPNRRVTFADDPEYEEDLRSYLDPQPLEDAEQTKPMKRVMASGAPGSAKGKGAGGIPPWSAVAVKVSEQVPMRKGATRDDSSAPSASVRESGANTPPPNTKAEEEEKEQKTTAANEEDAAEHHHDEDDYDQSSDDLEKIDMKELEINPTQTKYSKVSAADCKSKEAELKKKTEKTDHASKKTESEAADSSRSERLKDYVDIKAAEEEAEVSEEVEEDEEEEEEEEELNTEAPQAEGETDGGNIVIKKIATMDKRRDFALFLHSTDVMVVGGQSENGFYLDDILRIHVPSGQVCNTDGKLLIPLSGMRVECTAIHLNFLLQPFDPASCFYGE